MVQAPATGPRMLPPQRSSAIQRPKRCTRKAHQPIQASCQIPLRISKMSSSRRLATRLAALRPQPTPKLRLQQAANLRSDARPSHFYHSYDQPRRPGPLTDAESAILGAAYKYVPEYGFTQSALSLGAREAGFPDISTSILPDGAFSLVRYHLVTRREGLAGRTSEIFDGEDTSRPRVSEKVERLTWERLLGNKDVIHHWQDALALMAQPSYAPAALKELAMLSDEIWFLTGDTSVDPSWYTKRATLSTIYASSELFMTNDKSADFRDTRKFLGRRLEEVKYIGGMLGSIGQWVGFSARAGVNVLRSKGVRI
jgi:ubiquinone biosynthesis protein COQ9